MVTILIPTRFDSRYMLELCLESIRKYTSLPYQIVIGDAGTSDETKDYLRQQKDIKVINCPDPLRPKDFLAQHVSTPYFLFLHDDAQILKEGWLENRVKLIEQNKSNGIAGVISSNYVYGYRQYLTLSCVHKRFFPFGLLVKKEMQDDLKLNWGKLEGFDTGAIAYLQFHRQKKWRFVKYKFKSDIYHWGGMTWILRKKRNVDSGIEKSLLDVDHLIDNRNKKIEIIKNLIQNKEY